jgi:uncharacterized protein (TIGR02266 family)
MNPRIARLPKRRYRRRTVRVMVAYTGAAGPCVEAATTLGAGGLFIETETPLPEETRVKLRFRIPGGEIEHEIEGRVVWRRPSLARSSFAPGMGIEFTDRAAAARLAQELERLADAE